MARPVRLWLATCAVLVFMMIVAGGVTRVTHSGLSITTWNPVSGVLPPLTEPAWRDAFARYRASPEGSLVEVGISFDDFRTRYLIEYGHRLLARITGLTFVVPLCVFLVRRRLSWRAARPLLAVLALGLVQGIAGWAMVASGLIDVPRVGAFHLTTHLLLGVTLLAGLTWSAIEPRADYAPPRALGATAITLALAVAEIGLGGLMAGYHAGFVCSTFPTMNGAWVPPNVRASLGDAWSVHFAHRAVAALVALGVIATLAAWSRGRAGPRLMSRVLSVWVIAQVGLGAWLVTSHVPPAVAVLHQANGTLVVVPLVWLLRAAVRFRFTSVAVLPRWTNVIAANSESHRAIDRAQTR